MQERITESFEDGNFRSVTQTNNTSSSNKATPAQEYTAEEWEEWQAYGEEDDYDFSSEQATPSQAQPKRKGKKGKGKGKKGKGKGDSSSSAKASSPVPNPPEASPELKEIGRAHI